MSFVIYCPSATVGSIVKHYRTPKRDVRAVFGPSTRLSRRLVHVWHNYFTKTRSSAKLGTSRTGEIGCRSYGRLREARWRKAKRQVRKYGDRDCAFQPDVDFIDAHSFLVKAGILRQVLCLGTSHR